MWVAFLCEVDDNIKFVMFWLRWKFTKNVLELFENQTMTAKCVTNHTDFNVNFEVRAHGFLGI
jgi:hypothetical protein